MRHAIHPRFLLPLLSWFAALAAVAPTSARAQGLVDDTTEVRILRQFYYHTGGPQWVTRTHWLDGTTLADAAQWTGVTVENGDVTRLVLMSNQLTGPVPECLGRLTALRILDLSGNPSLGPTWPSAALSPLSRLEGLGLGNCQLTGALPDMFDHWPRLAVLDLRSNALTGTLPPTLVNAPALIHLTLTSNQLGGAVPGHWANRHGLRTLSLAGNAFLGMLPATLGRLSGLQTLNVAGNKLTGALPDSLARLSQLQMLNLTSNQLEGWLPSCWGQLAQLMELRLSDNRLSGKLPTEWSGMRQLQTLVLSSNQFEGQLPADWSRMPLVSLQLGNNRLSGAIPVVWGRFQHLNQLLLSSNQFSGALPDSLGRLHTLLYLEAYNNRLSGSIPASFTRLRNLIRLDLRSNELSGPLPDSLRVGYLLLTNNRLSGRLPASYASAWQQGIIQLLLDGNELTGIPAFSSPLGYPYLQAGLTNNYLQFDSYEANLTAPGSGQYQFFDYGQRTPAPADTQQTVAGVQPWLRRLFGGAHNHYQWQRRLGAAWVPVQNAPDADALQLPAATEYMEGEYRVQVTNDWLPWLTLYSKGLYLAVLPTAPLDRNEPHNTAGPVLVDAAPASRTATDAVNYVRTYTAQVALTDPTHLRAAAVENVQVKTDYFDGLGRSVQVVQHQASPGGRDVVQPLAHDALGRQPKQYLPYTVAPATGMAGAYRPNALREQFDFYRTPTATGIPATGVAYAETAFEASPLNRVLAQAAPGETWQLHAADNHAVHTAERPNHPDQDTVRRWQPGYGNEREDLQPNGVYAPGTLWVTQTTDEQGQTSRSYTDQEGRVVLKQVSLGKVSDYTVRHGTDTLRYTRRNWLSTYYVYDDFGRLRAVIPPLAEQRLRAHSWVVDGAGLERLLFRYHYDERGRLTEKKLPDQDGYAYMVYDVLDRLVLSQDAAQLTRVEWTATKYDTLGRVVLTALVRRPNQTRLQLQAAATAALARSEQPATVVGPGGAYYTNRAWPMLTATDDVLSTTDYDSYDFDHNGVADAHYLTQYDAELNQTGYQGAPDPRVTGQPTRTRTRVLGVAATAPGAWLTATSFFDEQLRPIQLQSSNARAGQDVVTTRFDFTGKPLVTMTVHDGPNHAPIALRETFAYDPTGRLLETRQELDGQAPVTIAANSYNELGQLQQKHLGGNKGQSALQSVDYAYNIRGWLTRVNDAQLTPRPGQRPDLFGLELSYDQGFITNQYNGNIAGQKWRTASDNVERAYGYRYDQLSRLLQGDFVARTAAGTWNAERDNYRFWAASYDANGNLLTMRRRGLVQEATRTTPRRYGEIDNLRYRFQPSASSPDVASNRLLRVDDLAPVASTFGSQQPTRPDFQDGATAGSTQPDYTYDAAGSLISDRNKDIDTITYNHLHLPARIVWANGNRLEFRYSAAGQKVTKLATAAGKPTVRTDYLGAWQYEGDTLRWLNTSEGRTLRFVQRDAAGQPLTRYSNEYTIKDHLGNLRVAFRPGDKAKHRATMEPALADQEEAQFDYVRETRHATTDAAAGQYVARLNAAVGKPIGPLKMLAVRKGDTLQIEAFSRYQQPAQNTNYVFSLLSFVTSLLQQPATPPTGEPHTTRPRALPFLGIGLAVVPQLVQLSNGVPKAYLRTLVFDKDSTLITSYTQQLTMAAQNNYQRLRINLTAPQDGFVQAYVGNESDVDVYFDDISIEYQPTLLVQENQYDPFGLDLVGLSKNTSNRFLYNSTEFQNEFGLSWNHYGARMYDAQIGKWATTDPMAESYFSFSPYNYVRNNPIMRIDPTGQWDITVHAYKDRSTYGYGVAVVTDCNGKEVYRFNVRLEGAKGHNRNIIGADTPTGVYDIPNKNMWYEVTQLGFIKNGKGTPEELRKNREAYGPNPRLILIPLFGEIVDTGRDAIRVHGGRQEQRDQKTGKWVRIEDPQLKRTNGCVRAFDADMVQLKSITDNLQKNNPDELGGVLKVVDDLEPRYEQTSTPQGDSNWNISFWIPGEYSADKNSEQFGNMLKDLFPNWEQK